MSMDGIHGLLSEVKNNKFSAIGPEFSDDDVVNIWSNVSSFIEKQMLQQKGVHIPGLGIFTFTQKKLDIGNNKFILIQRPIFMLSEKFAQTHGLTYTKHHTTGQIPVIQLNFAALAFESPFNRDAVEICFKEVLGAVARSVASKRNVQFSFSGIGRLQFRDNKVKMKFYKDFLNSMDSSGKLVDSLQNRPGTVDSVMSDRPLTRAGSSNTVLLPKISQVSLSGGAVPDPKVGMPTISEEYLDQTSPRGVDLLKVDDGDEKYYNPQNDSAFDEVRSMEEHGLPGMLMQDRPNRPQSLLQPVRSGSRIAVPMAQASGFGLDDDEQTPNLDTGRGPVGVLAKSSPSPLQTPGDRPSKLLPRPLSRTLSLDQIQPERSYDAAAAEMTDQSPPCAEVHDFSKPALLEPTPPGTGCDHTNAGQELCYLCHQRERRNIPVSFTEEKLRREGEEDRLLQQFQHMKDTEAIIKDQAGLLSKRHDSQKVAAFNLGVAEAVKEKGKERPVRERPRAYIFRHRPLTPPRHIQQQVLNKHLTAQVDYKDSIKHRKKSDEEFLERLEQVQLAEDLAAQREQYLKDKRDQTDQYKRALSVQLRFKPVPLPSREPDSLEPIFGKFDCTNEKLLEQKQRASNIYQQQVEIVAQRKREAILKRLQEQKDEEDMLHRARKELVEDRSERYLRQTHNRKRLEEDWQKAHDSKRLRELEERLRSRSPGILVHEQCDKYKRCGQCKRRNTNCGESNIWSESQYISGSRLIV